MRWKIDEPSDLSPDLEWLLLSGQASQALLAETLAEEFYPPVFNLALIFLGDEKAARATAQQTFQAALASSDRYRPAFGVKAWLFQQAVKSCQRAGLAAWGRQSFHKFFKSFFPGSGEETGTPRQLDDPLVEAIRALPGRLRMAILLRCLAGLEVREIAWILRQPEERVRAGLETTCQNLQGSLELPEESPAERLEPILSRRLSACCPTRPITIQERSQILASLARQGNRQDRLVTLENLGWVGLAVLAVIGFSWVSRPAALTPSPTPLPIDASTVGPTQTPDYSVAYIAQPGETLLSISEKTGIPLEVLIRINPYTPETVFNRARRVMLPEPPTPQVPTQVPPLSTLLDSQTNLSQPGSLQQRLSTQERIWQTLWVDAQFVNYGPPGYVGPSQAYRTQAWISWPGQSIQLVGPVRGEPLYRFLIEGNYIYFFSRESNASWYSESPELLVSWSALSSLIFPAQAKWLYEPGEFQVTGEEKAAGRSAIVAEWKDPSGQRLRRVWVDTQTGIILRQQEFGGQNGQTLMADYVITAITFNANFPPGLFDPSHNSLEYVQDYLGDPLTYEDPLQIPTPAVMLQREPFQREPAPTGFDPARSQLTFQSSDSQTSRDATTMIDLFAGQFYLGSLPFPDPWNIFCARSPDGRRLALSLKPGWQESGNRSNTGLRWFDLADLQIHEPPRLLEPSVFTFAPDSRRLAVFGQPAGSTPGIDLIDTVTGEIKRIADLEQAESLVWSPDGKQLALVGKRPGETRLEALILDIGKGVFTEHMAVDPNEYQQALSQIRPEPAWPALDWPAQGWDARFPVKMGGLEACSAAPFAATNNP